jgi:CTP synthase
MITEIGGTTGDIEGLPFLEAVRQMRLEEGFTNTLFVHVALVPILETTKEQKTKPLQHSVNELRRIGIQPDIVVARCSVMIEPEAQRKIALFANVEEKAVFCSPTVSNIYRIPILLDEQGMGDYICRRLMLQCKEPKWDWWLKILEGFEKPKRTVKVAFCGKYAKLADSYVSINESLKHPGPALFTTVKIDWIEAEIFEKNPGELKILSNYDGIVVPPGFGSRGAEGKILAAKYAREHNMPFLGICFGFQIAVIEFARNVCELKNANSVEISPETPYPVLDLMPEQRGITKLGGTMRLGAQEVKITPGTLAYTLYKSESIWQRHRHRFEVNPKYWGILTEHGLVFSGKSPDGRRIEIFEYPKNDFHFGVQFHPEFKSRPGKPDPAYVGFLEACLKKS